MPLMLSWISYMKWPPPMLSIYVFSSNHLRRTGNDLFLVLLVDVLAFGKQIKTAINFSHYCWSEHWTVACVACFQAICIFHFTKNLFNYVCFFCLLLCFFSSLRLVASTARVLIDFGRGANLEEFQNKARRNLCLVTKPPSFLVKIYTLVIFQ